MKKNILTLLFLNLIFFISCDQVSSEDLLIKGAANKEPSKKLTASDTLLSWMSFLDNQKKISEFSIPGTHDSGARHEPIYGIAKCQNLNITEQLNSGTRYLDIRCRQFYDSFLIHHGAIYQLLNFTDVLNSCSNFLAKNPSETIIMSVKEEYTGTGNKQSFEKTFDTYVKKNPNLWYLSDFVPALKTVKGKIVLLRRFSATTLPKGINATGWRDNTTFEINSYQSQLKIQDRYEVSNITTKWNDITSLAIEAKYGNKNTLYLNYTNGYKKILLGFPSIPAISDEINPKINPFIKKSKGRFGIFVMDFANSSINKQIIQTNFN